MKTITLCADDYGQNSEVSAGILELIHAGRLSAVSCMTGYAHWPQFGAQLAAIKADIAKRVDIGLHFDLTEFIATRGWSFNQLIVQSCLRRLDTAALTAELNRQLDAFEQVMGEPPEFIDGHQHIHVVPQIRSVFIQVLSARYPDKKPYVRLSWPFVRGHDAGIKAIILRILASGFARLARRHGFCFPRYFAGMYSLRPRNYRQLFRTWLAQSPSGTLIMCHPGLKSQDKDDPIRHARIREFDYLRSSDFLTDLQNNHTQLGKWQPQSH